MLDSEERYGFMVVDGNGALFAKVQGAVQEVLHQYNVTLPKKHSKGGQSSVRFARLRMIARHNYLTKVNELALKYFWDNDKNQANVTGIVLAGSADFKDQFNKHRIDPRLQKIVINVVDVANGGIQGLNQAVAQSSEVLKGVTLIKQRKIFSRFFEEIAMDTGKYCFGAKDTYEALEGGMIETLLVWDKLDILRTQVRNKATGLVSVVFHKEDAVPDGGQGNVLEVIESIPFIEYLADHYKEFGAQLEIVHDSTSE